METICRDASQVHHPAMIPGKLYIGHREYLLGGAEIAKPQWVTVNPCTASALSRGINEIPGNH